MASKRERAHDMAEKGLDKLVEGDKKGKDLVDKAKKIDRGAVDDLAKEVERDREQADQFTGRRR